CALCAAALWGLNLTAIYPVLQILGNKTSMQKWIDGQIKDTQNEIDKLRPEINDLSEQRKNLEEKHPSKLREKYLRHFASDLRKKEDRIARSSTYLNYCPQGKKYIDQLLPPDCFQTLALILGLVVVGIAIKGVFELGQESLVGSVVNLSLYDMRIRFY